MNQVITVTIRRFSGWVDVDVMIDNAYRSELSKSFDYDRNPSAAIESAKTYARDLITNSFRTHADSNNAQAL